MHYQYQRIAKDNDSVARSDDAFFEKYNIRTDLAMEATEVIVEREGPPEIPGVVVQNEVKGNAKINRTRVETDAGARAIGKVKGNYVTIESQALSQHNREVQLEIGELIAEEVETFLGALNEEDHVLVVGLGNWNATPDALGPRVIDKLLVTRHLFSLAPPEMRGGLRPVSALAPGVLGITGIETGETIQGVAEKVKPKMIICIDALASRSTERLCTTIQVADTGIHPGSGIGNMRLGITPQTMGVPVVAIGVPTVIHAVTLVSDGMEMISQVGEDKTSAVPMEADTVPRQDAPTSPNLQSSMLDPSRIQVTGDLGVSMEMEREDAFVDAVARSKMNRLGRRLGVDGVPGIDEATKRRVLRQLLEPYMGTMVVTPKEIDVLMADAAWVVACGLNIALHPGMDTEQAAQYTL